jgi:hypothetical protein
MDEQEFAEATWENTRKMASEGDPAGEYMWAALNRYYPGDKSKQVRVLGFLNEVFDQYGKSISEEDARALAEKWGVEDLLLKQKGFVISLN